MSAPSDALDAPMERCRGCGHLDDGHGPAQSNGRRYCAEEIFHEHAEGRCGMGGPDVTPGAVGWCLCPCSNFVARAHATS